MITKSLERGEKFSFFLPFSLFPFGPFFSNPVGGYKIKDKDEPDGEQVNSQKVCRHVSPK